MMIADGIQRFYELGPSYRRSMRAGRTMCAAEDHAMYAGRAMCATGSRAMGAVL